MLRAAWVPLPATLAGRLACLHTLIVPRLITNWVSACCCRFHWEITEARRGDNVLGMADPKLLMLAPGVQLFTDTEQSFLEAAKQVGGRAAPVADASPPAAGTAGPGDEEPEDEAPWQTMVAGRTSAEARTLQPAGLERRPQQQQPPRVQQQQAARQQQQQQQVRPGAEQDEVELWSLLAQLGLEGDSQAGRSAAAAAGGPSSSRPATGGAWPAPAAVPLAAPTTPVLVPPVPLPAAPAAAGAAPERQQQPEMPPAIHKALQELVRLLECPLGLVRACCACCARACVCGPLRAGQSAYCCCACLRLSMIVQAMVDHHLRAPALGSPAGRPPRLQPTATRCCRRLCCRRP